MEEHVGSFRERFTGCRYGQFLWAADALGANRAAKAKCKSMGGQECKIILAFKNQCAVVAEPIEDLPLYRLVHRPGLTVEEASSVALSECASLNQGHACKVIFSICSNPIRVN
ncbi:MAG: hypothetical protein DI562_12125 [Stenotrophomonas acidaminiphila]|nr:MAG: hypothetical protein DI562_12125 [Stenotrophomonas acidaminiphila]